MDQFPVFLDWIVDKLSLSAGSFHWIEGSEVPRPYRDLLVHNKDMTSTLAEGLSSTFCARDCHVGNITAGDASGAGSEEASILLQMLRHIKNAII